MAVKHNSGLSLLVAGLIFALIAIAHLLRIIYHTDITIAGQPVSMNVSYVSFVVALVLSIWMFRSHAHK